MDNNNKKRIVFVNLHSDWMLLTTMSVFLFKQSAAVKHKYIIEHLLEDPNFEVCTYINKRGFSLLKNGSKNMLNFFNLFRFMEHDYILGKNGIEKSKITVLKSEQEICSDDIVILYNVHKDTFIGMENIDAFKAVSMLHFNGQKGEDDTILKSGAACLFNESNLQKNSKIYGKYYKLDLPFIVHPFVYATRFQNKKSFKKRQNKAFATGTITYKHHQEFLDIYGDQCNQPSRKQIKDNPEFFKFTIDCTSSDYLEDMKSVEISKKDNEIVALIKKTYNRFHMGQQKKYFSFDMVEKFNDYKMCVVGEEILGCPGIGFVEGMACGAAYIGLNSPMYTDLGLIPNVHYITYDGSKEDLKAKIEYYQREENQEELEEIAAAGCDFVRNNFNADAVAEKLIQDLINEQNKWLANK